MDDVLEIGTLKGWLLALRDWFFDRVLVWDTLAQIPIVALALVGAYLLARAIRPWARAQIEARALPAPLAHGLEGAVGLAFPALGVLLLWFSVGIAGQLAWDQGLVRIVASLLTAWVVIRFVSHLVGRGFWTRLIATGIWVIAALNILDLLDPTIGFLDGIAITLGEWRLSALAIIKGLAVLALLLWLGALGSRFVERRLRQSRDLSPSLQVLLAKLIRIGAMVVAIVVALNSIGVDLSGLAIFSGALGVGIGFGLQRVVANLVSGISLLLDKSIKPGDVIEVGGTYGWIDQLNARYVSVVTRDGTEHLIPNEELISQRVINWSHSNDRIRIRIPIGVAYGSDVARAIELVREAAAVPDRVLAHPAPVCFITGFGDSSIDLEARIWIRDPRNGVSNVKGAVLLEIWKRFAEHGIEIPFPQRDLHIRSGPPVPIRVYMEKPAPSDES